MPESAVTFTGAAVIEYLGGEYEVKMDEPQSYNLALEPERSDLRALVEAAVDRSMSTGADVLADAMNMLENDQLIFIIELKDQTIMREELPEGSRQ